MIPFLIRRITVSIGAFFIMTFAVWLMTTYHGEALFNHPSLALLAQSDYPTWINHILHGDFGVSTRYRIPVTNLFSQYALATLLLIVPAFILQEIISVLLGMFTSATKGSIFDRTVLTISSAVASFPPFWLSLMGIAILCVQFHFFSFNGIINARYGLNFNTPEYWAYFHDHPIELLGDMYHHLGLPVILLALSGLAQDTQLVRVTMLDVLSQEYIRAATARGLSRVAVVGRHAFRNALLPFITNIGIQLPRLVFAAAITEFIFVIPGIGSLFITSSYAPGNSRDISQPLDLNIVTAAFFILGTVTLLSTIITDVAYALADPRIRQQG